MRPDDYYKKLMKEKKKMEEDLIKIEEELKKIDTDTLQFGVADYERIPIDDDGEYSHIIRVSPIDHVGNMRFARNRVKVVWCNDAKTMLEDLKEVTESLLKMYDKLYEKYKI